MSWIGFIIIVSILRVIFLMLNDYLVGKATLNIFNKIRLRLYQHLQWLSAGFYQRCHMDSLVSSYSRDLLQAETTTRQVLPLLITNTLIIVFSITILFYYQWRLALLVFILFFLILLIAFCFMRKAQEITRQNQIANATISSMIDEVATQHLLVQAFNLQESFFRKFKNRILEKYRDEFIKGIFFRTLIGRTSVSGLLLAEVIIFSIGILMASKGIITIGTLFIFFSLVWNLSGSVVSLSLNLLPNFVESGVSMQRLDELFSETTDQPIENERYEDKEIITRINEKIEFCNVSLIYHQKSVIQDVLLEIPIGSSTAFVA